MRDEQIWKFDRYKENLTRVGNKIYSYTTHVATLDFKNNRLLQHGWWSVTTQKHINYVGREYQLDIVEEALEA
jgi:hypothetical protein|tara:strand:+ start:18 stop:236 length:219 start_codon:yes stop_codon:yes gene_type:complete